ncbi:MAG: hypothetical protein EKK48_22290 [Candidatus Melainabacteria bacterium]|nr:MAG: hypothetical protein EKK48_22290 [Candidatus Melainabacteria bacterium]
MEQLKNAAKIAKVILRIRKLNSTWMTLLCPVELNRIGFQSKKPHEKQQNQGALWHNEIRFGNIRHPLPGNTHYYFNSG